MNCVSSLHSTAIRFKVLRSSCYVDVIKNVMNFLQLCFLFWNLRGRICYAMLRRNDAQNECNRGSRWFLRTLFFMLRSEYCWKSLIDSNGKMNSKVRLSLYRRRNLSLKAATVYSRKCGICLWNHQFSGRNWSHTNTGTVRKYLNVPFRAWNWMFFWWYRSTENRKPSFCFLLV